MGKRRKRTSTRHNPPAGTPQSAPPEDPGWPKEVKAYDAIVRCQYPRRFGTFMPGGQVLPALFRAVSDPLLRNIIIYESQLGIPPTYDIHPYKVDPAQPDRELAWGTISVLNHSPSDVIRLLRVEAKRPDKMFVGTDYGVEGQYVARDRKTNELRAFVIAQCVAEEGVNGLQICNVGDVDEYLSKQLTTAADHYYLGEPDKRHWQNAPLEYPMPDHLYRNMVGYAMPDTAPKSKETVVNLPESHY